ncbi:MAG: MFS transporter [Pirellulaceae bacterium]|nr:MFS transporter [Pirellulaceae bacterium]
MQTHDNVIEFQHRSYTMLALVLAGEAIFFLPFVVARIFRPTLLDVFEITNLQLGVAFSAYGTFAMLSYFPGGLLADRFDARRLMVAALLSTALGGIAFAMTPGFRALVWLFGFWGVTTILMFWAALIRVTRQWGGQRLQGTAFGLLDAGRGLSAAAIGSIGVVALGWMLPDAVETATLDQRRAALARVILGFTIATAATAIIVWYAIPARKTANPLRVVADSPGVLATVRLPAVWAQAVAIVCAYVCYKGLDDVSLFARDVMRLDEVRAARASTMAMWIRPPAALVAGLVADRWRVSSMMMISFAVVAFGSGIIASGWIQWGGLSLFYLTIATTSAAVFGLRGLYFAMMEEGKIPVLTTGTAVGVVSVIGFTPDIFMGPLTGYLLDRSPGPQGHQHLFAVVACFAIAGFLAAAMLRIRIRLIRTLP